MNQSQPNRPNLDDYVPVHERIAAFYEKYPEGSLQAEITVHTETIIAMVARAFRTPDDARPGVGHSSIEVPGRTPYTRGSEMENCETSAWGRAIAALGFEIKRGIATAEEVANKAGAPQRPAQAPRTAQEPRKAPDPTPRPAQSAGPTGGNAPSGDRMASQPASGTAATSAASTLGGDLSEDDWAGLIEQTPTAKPTTISSAPGLSSRDFFTNTDNAGIDRKHVTNKAKQIFGAENWKVTDLSDEQRAQLWFELEPVPA